MPSPTTPQEAINDCLRLWRYMQDTPGSTLHTVKSILLDYECPRTPGCSAKTGLPACFPANAENFSFPDCKLCSVTYWRNLAINNYQTQPCMNRHVEVSTYYLNHKGRKRKGPDVRARDPDLEKLILICENSDTDA